MKLVVGEAESKAFLAWFRVAENVTVSSDLLRTELVRAARRVGARYVQRAHEVLESLNLVTLSTSTFERAALLEPPRLRSLDALHLAMALELGDVLQDFVTYDEHLAQAAAHHGLRVLSPR
jgi:predicted nucleic acid-binding protein